MSHWPLGLWNKFIPQALDEMVVVAVEVVVVFVVVAAVFVKVKQQLTATTSEWLELFLMTNLEASLRIDLFSRGSSSSSSSSSSVCCCRCVCCY